MEVDFVEELGVWYNDFCCVVLSRGGWISVRQPSWDTHLEEQLPYRLSVKIRDSCE